MEKMTDAEIAWVIRDGLRVLALPRPEWDSDVPAPFYWNEVMRFMRAIETLKADREHLSELLAEIQERD